MTAYRIVTSSGRVYFCDEDNGIMSGPLSAMKRCSLKPDDVYHVDIEVLHERSDGVRYCVYTAVWPKEMAGQVIGPLMPALLNSSVEYIAGRGYVETNRPRGMHK